MREKRFWPFFCVQFLGAFNDNVFKTALITLVVFHAASLTMLDPGMLATLLPGLFILPFLLFSATAGQIADKFEKAKLMRLVKLFELGIMLLAAAGFVLHLLWLLVLVLFMMGMHSTLFGPIKYAYLPQHLSERELVGGNGMVEMGTFSAILLGQILGAWLAMRHGGELLTGAVVVALAVIGYGFSRQVPTSPAADADLRINWNPVGETFKNIASVSKAPSIWLAIIAISWFWFYGATLLAQFPQLAKGVLHGDESLFVLLLAVFSVGVGIGSLICERLSKGLVEIGLVPIGAIGLSLFGVDLYVSSTNIHNMLSDPVLTASTFVEGVSQIRLLADIALIGFSGGIFIVPLYALIQTRAPKTHQSRVIAANNMMNALFMVFSAGFSMVVFVRGFTIPQLLLMTALLNALMLLYICWRAPEYWVRMLGFWRNERQ